MGTGDTVTDKVGSGIHSLRDKGRRRNSTSTADVIAASPSSSAYLRGRAPSPMRSVTSLVRPEYFRSEPQLAAGVPSSRERALSRGLSERVRRSDEGTRVSGSGKDPAAGAGAATAPAPSSGASPHSPKSPAKPLGGASPGHQLGRQQSDSKLRAKSLLSSTGELPSSFRQAARVGSYNGRAVSAALSATVPAVMGRSGRASGVNPEQETQLGDAIIGYGSSSFQGLRDYQEDTVAFLQGMSGLAGAVYDGHGGDQVSKELERVLLQNLMRTIGDLNARDQDTLMNIQAAISQTYVATNREIFQRMASAAEAGSCAVTFVITRAAGSMHLFCANAGDCRAVLYTGPSGSKRAVRLSEDHKPHPQVCPSEIKRVTSAGGCVLWGRVQGCLAVSRAFGDKSLAPYVIADPYVSSRPLNLDQDSFLYLASDGVTDMVDDTTGCQVIADQLARGQSTSQAAAALVSTAYQKGSSDNISVVVVRLRRRT